MDRSRTSCVRKWIGKPFAVLWVLHSFTVYPEAQQHHPVWLSKPASLLAVTALSETMLSSWPTVYVLCNVKHWDCLPRSRQGPFSLALFHAASVQVASFNHISKGCHVRSNASPVQCSVCTVRNLMPVGSLQSSLGGVMTRAPWDL